MVLAQSKFQYLHAKGILRGAANLRSEAALRASAALRGATALTKLFLIFASCHQCQKF